MFPAVILITNCTNRKRAVGDAVTLSEASLTGSLESVARRWAKALKRAPYNQEARRLYGGRSFAEASNAAKVVQGELYVISAGLGLIHAAEQIPMYDLTVSEGRGSIAPFLSSARKNSADWWSALNNELSPSRSIRSLITTHKRTPILFALPAGYLALISRDLADLTAEESSHVRIITSKLGKASVPGHLRDLVLPYDERLEGSPYTGTRTDFPQRALLHFVTELNGHTLSLKNAHHAVQDAMKSLRKPVIPSRAKKTNDEILAILRQSWGQCDGTSTRLLRFLRDDVLVACEQSRFQSLWHQVKEELRTQG